MFEDSLSDLSPTELVSMHNAFHTVEPHHKDRLTSVYRLRIMYAITTPFEARQASPHHTSKLMSVL